MVSLHPIGCHLGAVGWPLGVPMMPPCPLRCPLGAMGWPLGVPMSP